MNLRKSAPSVDRFLPALTLPARRTTSPSTAKHVIASEARQDANDPARRSAATKTTARRDAGAQRSEDNNGLSYPASLRLCARHNSLGFHDLGSVPSEIFARKQDLNRVWCEVGRKEPSDGETVRRSDSNKTVGLSDGSCPLPVFGSGFVVYLSVFA
jgi:hypothetical protein